MVRSTGGEGVSWPISACFSVRPGCGAVQSPQEAFQNARLESVGLHIPRPPFDNSSEINPWLLSLNRLVFVF